MQWLKTCVNGAVLHFTFLKDVVHAGCWLNFEVKHKNWTEQREDSMH